MVYSKISSSSRIDVETIGLPSALKMAWIIELSGTLIPTVFRFLNGFGRLFEPGRINV